MNEGKKKVAGHPKHMPRETGQSKTANNHQETPRAAQEAPRAVRKYPRAAQEGGVQSAPKDVGAERIWAKPDKEFESGLTIFKHITLPENLI